jgi:hypothetical protein
MLEPNVERKVFYRPSRSRPGAGNVTNAIVAMRPIRLLQRTIRDEMSPRAVTVTFCDVFASTSTDCRQRFVYSWFFHGQRERPVEPMPYQIGRFSQLAAGNPWQEPQVDRLWFDPPRSAQCIARSAQYCGILCSAYRLPSLPCSTCLLVLQALRVHESRNQIRLAFCSAHFRVGIAAERV